jgi:hypothetical protein
MRHVVADEISECSTKTDVEGAPSIPFRLQNLMSTPPIDRQEDGMSKMDAVLACKELHEKLMACVVTSPSWKVYACDADREAFWGCYKKNRVCSLIYAQIFFNWSF